MNSPFAKLAASVELGGGIDQVQRVRRDAVMTITYIGEDGAQEVTDRVITILIIQEENKQYQLCVNR